jgi:tight adherence protein B
MTAGRRSQHGRESIIELAEALAAELRTGAAPRTAMLRAAEGEPLLHWVAVAARSPAGDVAAALRDLAALPGAAGAADLAAAWSVTETTGGSLATPVGRIAGGLRDDEQVRREVSAQLAGPRATAVLLAVLPLFGLLLGSALGAAPLPLLVASPVGPVLLVPGLLLELAGVLWTLRITRRAGPRDG